MKRCEVFEKGERHTDTQAAARHKADVRLRRRAGAFRLIGICTVKPAFLPVDGAVEEILEVHGPPL